MDIGTVVGLILGNVLMVGSILVGGGNIMAFVDIPSVFITIGGTISAILINYPLEKVSGAISIAQKAFTTKLASQEELIKTFLEFA